MYNQYTWGVDPSADYSKSVQSKCNWAKCCPEIPKEPECPVTCPGGKCDTKDIGVYCPIHKRRHYFDKCKEKNQVTPEFILIKQSMA